MSNRLRELADRRRALVVQSERLRLQLAASAQPLRQALGFADVGLVAGRALARQPLLMLAAVGAGLFVLKRGRTARALSVVLSTVSLLSQLRRLLPARR